MDTLVNNYLPVSSRQLAVLNKESNYTFTHELAFHEQVAEKFNIPELRGAERSDDLFVFIQLGDTTDPIWIFRVLANHLFVKKTFTHNEKAIARYLARIFKAFSLEDQKRANHFRSKTESFPHALNTLCLWKNYHDIEVPVGPLDTTESEDRMFNIVISETPQEPSQFILFAMERKYPLDQIAKLLIDYGSEFISLLVKYLVKVDFKTDEYEELYRWNMELVEVLSETFVSEDAQENIRLYKELVDVRLGRAESLSFDVQLSRNHISRLIFDIAVLGKKVDLVRRILRSNYLEYTPYSESYPLLFCNIFDILNSYEFWNLPQQYLRQFFRYHDREIFEHFIVRRISLVLDCGDPTETLLLTGSTSESLQRMGAPANITFEFDQRLLDEAYLPNRLNFLLRFVVPESREHASQLLEEIIEVINRKYLSRNARIIDQRVRASYKFLEALVNSKDLREKAQKVGLKFQADYRYTAKLLEFDLSQVGPIIEFDLDYDTLLHIRSDTGFRNFEAVSKKSIRQILEYENLGRTIEAREAKTFMLTGSRKTAYYEPMDLPLTNVKPREARFYESIPWY